MNAHKLIIDRSVIKDDYQSALVYPIESQSRYMLIHQISRITADKGSLLQDDRLDALAIATNYWVQQMAANADLNMNDRKTELLDKELDKFISSALGRKTNQHTNSWF